MQELKSSGLTCQVTYSEVPGPSLTPFPPILFPFLEYLLFSIIIWIRQLHSLHYLEPPLLTVTYTELIEVLCKYVPLQNQAVVHQKA